MDSFGIKCSLCLTGETDYLSSIAEEKKLEEFFGYIEASNRKMQRLCEKLGMIREQLPEGLVKVRLLLG